MDRRAAFYAAQGGRSKRLGDLVRRRRSGRNKGRFEHADRQGHGRRARGLRHERRASAASARFSAAFGRAWFRRHLQYEVGAPDQSDGPVFHELQRLRSSGRACGRSCARHADRTQVGHHVPIRQSADAGQRILRDQRTGLVRWGRHSSRGGIHRWRQDVEPRRVQESPTTHGARPVRLSVELGWDRDRDSFARHPTRSGRCSPRESRSPSSGTCLSNEITECLG